MGRTIYLDHAATTPMRPEAWEAMAPFATDVFGNASGGHAVSRRAKNALEEARERAAFVLGCRPGEIIFTGGGTESDNLAVKGAFRATRRSGLVTTAIEHEAVAESVHRCARDGANVVRVAVGRDGCVVADDVGDAVTDDTALVSVMLANNETGAIQPVAEVVSAVAGRAPVHTDAVQAFSTVDFDVDSLGVDLASLAGHKFGGPKGVGLLYARQGVDLEPVLDGGGQELGRRSGTSNVMGAVGMAVAMELAVKDRERTKAVVTEARRAFESALQSVAMRTIPESSSLGSHSHLRFPGVRNETLLVRLDQRDVAVSVGSACASGAASVSPVLSAMGFTDDESRECLRFSFGWTSTVADGIDAAQIVTEILR